jgi:hypothetical protein
MGWLGSSRASDAWLLTVPVADNRETVLPGAAVALIGFGRYGSKNGRSATVRPQWQGDVPMLRHTLTAHCLI